MVRKNNGMNNILNLSSANHIRDSLAPYLIDKSMGNNSHPWAGIYKMVTSRNHTFCSLCRDNWACYGEQYDKSLELTPPYQGYTFLDLPRNTVIFAEGNSLLAEKLYYLVCETSKFMLNNHGNNSRSDFLLKNTYANDMFLHIAINNFLLVLIDNHYSLNTTNVIGILHKMVLLPHIIIVGHTNKGADESKRYNAYKMGFPYVPLINQTFGFSHRSCTAPSCKNDSSRHHQCLPGPSVIDDAQELMQTIMNVVITRDSYK